MAQTNDFMVEAWLQGIVATLKPGQVSWLSLSTWAKLAIVAHYLKHDDKKGERFEGVVFRQS